MNDMSKVLTGEELVRYVWKKVEVCGCESAGWFVALNGDLWSIPYSQTKNMKAMWDAAVEFTRRRLEEIREVEHEIRWVETCIEQRRDHGPMPLRVLGIEKQALADLKKGTNL